MGDMEQNAIWLAQIFGPFLTVIGFWMLLTARYLEPMWKKIKDQTGSFYTWGVVYLFVGIVILTMYHEWSRGPYVFVTILGWMYALLGIGTLFTANPIAKLLYTNRNFIQTRGIIPLVWGLILIAVGYFNV